MRTCDPTLWKAPGQVGAVARERQRHGDDPVGAVVGDVDAVDPCHVGTGGVSRPAMVRSHESSVAA